MAKAKKIFSYFKEVREEVQKVTWPSKKETIRYSIITVIFSLAVAIFFAILDFIFNIGLESLIRLT